MKLTAKPGKGEKIHLSLDGEYIATVNADYWFTCGIKSGSEVTPEQLEELLTESARRKMMNKALDLLSMRDYSRRELSDKLVTKAWEKKEQKDMDLGSLKQQASDICDRLEELGLLNEERFARSYVDAHGDPTSLAPHERLTDLAVVPREKPHTGAAAREQPRDSPVIER